MYLDCSLYPLATYSTVAFTMHLISGVSWFLLKKNLIAADWSTSILSIHLTSLYFYRTATDKNFAPKRKFMMDVLF